MITTPRTFFFSIPIIAALLVGGVLWIGGNISSRLARWQLVVLPVCFTVFALSFTLFVQIGFLRHVLVAVVTILVGVVLHNIYTFARQSHQYQPYALENISGYLNILSFFFVTSSLLYAKLLVTIPVWFVALCIACIAFVLTLQTLWSQKVSGAPLVRYSALFGLIWGELVLAFSFLPAGPVILSLLLTVVYYFCIMMVRDYLLDRLERNIIQRYAFFTVTLVFLIIITARWV